QSNVSRPPVAATWARAVPHAPPPTTANFLMLMPSPPRRAPFHLPDQAASGAAPEHRADRPSTQPTARLLPVPTRRTTAPADHCGIVRAQPGGRNRETAALIFRQ